MAQTKTIQLLRSSSVYESASAARTAVAAMTGQDGEIRIARYNAAAQGETEKIQSMLCVYHAAPQLPTGKPAGWTFIEDVSNNADSPEALRQLIDNVITGAGLATGTGAFVVKAGDDIIGSSTSITDAVNDIADYIQGLNQPARTNATTDGKVLVTLSETDGLVTETASDLTDVKMGGYTKTSDTGAIAATDTLEVAFSKIENTIAKNTVSSSDSTIIVDTTGSATDIKANIDGTTIVKSNAGVLSADLTVAKLNASEVTALSDANVKEAYKLIYATDTNRTAIGDVVKIYKDSALQNVYMGHIDDTLSGQDASGESTSNTVVAGTGDDALCFVYQLANGKYKLEAVNVQAFLKETEFKDGLTVDTSNHTVSVKIGNGLELGTAASDGNKPVQVKIDSTSESFLTVGANGVKLSGVQSAIDTAKQTIDAYTVNGKAINTSPVLDGTDINVDGTASTPETVAAAIARLDAAAAGAKTIVAEGTDAGNNMTITKTTDATTQADTYTISLSGIAQDSEVVKSVNTKTPTNGAVTVGGGDIALTNYSKGSSADPVAATDTVNAAISKLENQVDAAMDAATAAHTAVEHATGNTHVTVSASQPDQTTGKVTYTVNETNIADADDLTAEIAARKAVDGQSGDTYTANANANYISGATSLNNADVLLDTALKTADDAMLTQINGSNAIEVSTKANKQQTVSLKLDTTTATGNITSDMLEINSNGLMMKNVWDCGTF